MVVTSKKTSYGFDSKCRDLAEHFLQDVEHMKGKPQYEVELANIIQRAIEDWLRHNTSQVDLHDEIERQRRLMMEAMVIDRPSLLHFDDIFNTRPGAMIPVRRRR